MDLEERKELAKAVEERSKKNARDPKFLRRLQEVQNNYGTIRPDKLNKRLNI